MHKRHHEMKITNVYGHLVDSELEKLCIYGMTIASDLVVAYTVGQDLFTTSGFLIYSVSQDLHIHCGYTVPWIPFNWWNVGQIQLPRGLLSRSPNSSIALLFFQPEYYHNAHHSQNNTNYSAFFSLPLISWDWWMGTDARWKRYRLAGDDVRRHRNTWPGFAVEGDLEANRDDTAEEIADSEDEAK